VSKNTDAGTTTTTTTTIIDTRTTRKRSTCTSIGKRIYNNMFVRTVYGVVRSSVNARTMRIDMNVIVVQECNDWEVRQVSIPNRFSPFEISKTIIIVVTLYRSFENVDYNVISLRYSTRDNRAWSPAVKGSPCIIYYIYILYYATSRPFLRAVCRRWSDNIIRT